MLVLGMKPGQGFRIGKDVEVRILELANNDLVRVGVIAPPEVKILRNQLIEKELEAAKTDEKGSP